MKDLNFKFFLSALALSSIMTATSATAAPVRFNQVVQVVNAKPGKAGTNNFAQLRLADDNPVLTGDDETKKKAPPIQDDRVITETRSEIVEEEVCDCENEPLPVIAAAFPYWTLGFAAVPLAFLIPPGDDEDSPTTPTPTTPTPTTPIPPAPVPEPMTIILFGTGLASIGLAARRRFGKKNDDEIET